MTEYEWLLRCQREYARATNEWQYNWEWHAKACYEEFVLDNGFAESEFANDPEGAAQEELSNLG